MTVLTHQEAAAFLKVNDATLRKLRRSGQIHGVLVGTQYRYIREHLEAYLEGAQISPRPNSLAEASGHLTVVKSEQSPIDEPRRPVHHRAFYSLQRKATR